MKYETSWLQGKVTLPSNDQCTEIVLLACFILFVGSFEWKMWLAQDGSSL